MLYHAAPIFYEIKNYIDPGKQNISVVHNSVVLTMAFSEFSISFTFFYEQPVEYLKRPVTTGLRDYRVEHYI